MRLTSYTSAMTKPQGNEFRGGAGFEEVVRESAIHRYRHTEGRDSMVKRITLANREIGGDADLLQRGGESVVTGEVPLVVVRPSSS